MKKPKVSVIVPAYNSEKTLKYCLNSLINQDYKNYEILVIDNNSTDKTKQIINFFQKKSKKIRYLFESKKSRGAARNKGIEKVKTEIILMTDSDCITPKDWISKMTEVLIKENQEIVMGYEENTLKNFWSNNIHKENKKFLKNNLKNDYIDTLDTKNIIVRTKLMKKLKFNPDLKNLEDFDLFIRLKHNNIKIRFAPEIRVKHFHKNSFSKTIKLNFDRGYWAQRIYQNHKNKNLKKIRMFDSFTFKSFLFFPIFILISLLKKPKTGFFLLFWEISWRYGILFGKLKIKR